MKYILGILMLSLAGAANAGWWDSFLETANQVVSSKQIKQAAVAGLSNQEVAAGLKEALKVGSESVVSKLGKPNGFLMDKAVEILLPEKLQMADEFLGKFGMNSLTNNLKVRMNHAAEAAMPHAKDVFFKAIDGMTLQDAANILAGSNNEATTYFKDKMTPNLIKKLTPIVNQQLGKSGAIQAYSNVVGQVSKYAKMPLIGQLAPDINEDLTSYTVSKMLDGAFHYLALEEAKIRTNPVARSTDLLKKVFQK